MHGRRRTVLAALVVLAMAPTAQAAQPLRVQGSRLVDERGRTVILHGVNVVYKPPPYYPNASSGERTSFDRDDVRRLRAWGFNTIRLGITWKALMPAPGVVDRRYLDRIVALTRLAARGGLYVLLDMHQDLWGERYQGNGAPEWATIDDGQAFTPRSDPFPLNYLQPAVGRAFTNFYDNRDGIRTRYRRAWEAVARAVRGEPGVLGFDLLNEPVCELSAGAPCTIPPQPEAYRRWLAPLYDDLIPALRRADPTHPSFYEEGVTVNAGFPMLFGRASVGRWRWRGAGLSHHVYCTPLLRNAPCSRQEADAFREAAAAGRRNGVAPLLTEFGATNDLRVLRRIVDAADRAGEGWQYWQYKTYFDPTTAASSEPGGADAESLVDERGRIKTAKLRVLARIYPERIAGTGARWSYNDRTKRFRMSWRARPGADTVIRVPAFIRVDRAVLGGRVTLRFGRRVLLLRGSGPVSVTL